MKEWVQVLRAADAAARWHVHQRRKGAAEEPYINHLLEVAMLVAEATEGKDPSLPPTLALPRLRGRDGRGLLHDAVEDQEVPFEIIARMFGDDVASLVKEVTDDKTKHKQDRKDHQVKHTHKASHRAKVLKLADKTSNLKSLAAGPPKDWSVKRRMEYVKWARDVVRGLKGASPWLEAEFEAAAKEAERSTIFRR